MKIVRLLPALVLAAACSSADDVGRQFTLAPNSDLAPAGSVGQVYTASNSVSGNAILAFNRAADGSLSPAGSYATGGVGTGAGLGNQGGVILTGDGRYLLVVNAASNDVSSFLVRGDGSLELMGTVASGGERPVSVTESNGIVYVLNAGGTGGIAGFTLHQGKLSPIAGATRPLSSSNAGAAQVQFDHAGRVLIVTEKATNSLSSYVVDRDGVAYGPTVTTSNGATPFGFAVSRGVAVVSEAFGGAPGAGALSSYRIGSDGTLATVSASVATTETAACWVAITNDGRFAYTTNAGSATISGYRIEDGKLSLLDADGVTATTEATPIDLAVSRNSQFIYSLNAGGHSISAFAIGVDGALDPVAAGATGLPAGTNGLAAR